MKRLLTTLAACLFACVSCAAVSTAQDADGHPRDLPDNDALVYRGELPLPDIVRFDNLPKRMFLEPDLTPPGTTYYLGDDYVEMFGRLLAADHDHGLLIDAVCSVRRAVAEGLIRPDDYVPDLRRLLISSNNRDLQRLCAVTLADVDASAAADDLLSFCEPEWESVSIDVEPALARWKHAAAEPMWLQRINNVDEYSSVLVRLACTGLAAVQADQAVATLTTVLLTDRNRYADRHAAAEALALLAPHDAAGLAATFQQGDVSQRLLGVALLQQAAGESALTSLDTFCGDKAGAVASRAWETMAVRDPERLIDRLEAGRRHPDANVRFVTVRMLQKFASPEHSAALQQMLADAHIGVRNAARRAIFAVAESAPELRDGIQQRAGEALSDNRSNWQQLEQSLVLLGQLRHPAYQADSLLLLRHDRPEVFTTAAWVLHLMPRHELSEELAAITLDLREFLAQIGLEANMFAGLFEQITHLLQHAGQTRERLLHDLARRQYSKQSGLSSVGRAAGLWTLGFLEEGNPDPELIAAYLERIFDDDPLVPEDDRVRLVCVLSIARQNGRSAVSELRRAHDRFGVGSKVAQAVRHVMPQFGGEPMPDPQVIRNEVGGWLLSPVRTR